MEYKQIYYSLLVFYYVFYTFYRENREKKIDLWDEISHHTATTLSYFPVASGFCVPLNQSINQSHGIFSIVWSECEGEFTYF